MKNLFIEEGANYVSIMTEINYKYMGTNTFNVLSKGSFGKDAIKNAEHIVKCVNDYERLLNDLKDTQSAIEHIINATPTGTTRNLLCDLNLNLLNSISQ